MARSEFLSCFRVCFSGKGALRRVLESGRQLQLPGKLRVHPDGSCVGGCRDLSRAVSMEQQAAACARVANGGLLFRNGRVKPALRTVSSSPLATAINRLGW